MPFTPNRESNTTPIMLEMPEERGGEERRRARTPCTVTAPARVAGHRLPVWANKIGRALPLLCELKEDRENVKVGDGLRLYGGYGGPSVWGRARRLEGLLEQEELVCGWWMDKVGERESRGCGAAR